MPLPAHVFSGPQIRNVLRKWYQKSWNHSFYSLPKKSDIAKHACEPRLRGLLVEDALVKKQYLGQKKFRDLITADHKVLNEESESRKQSPIRSRGTRSCHSAQNENFTGDWKEFEKVLRTVEEARNFWHTIHWNYENLVKNYHGIIERRNFMDPRLTELPKRAVRRVKEGTSAVLPQSGLDEKMMGWFYGVRLLSCETSQDFLADRKTRHERTVRRTFQGTDNTVRSNGWISFRFQQRINPDVTNLARHFYLEYVLGWAGGIWKGDILIANLEELEKMDATGILSTKSQCERSDVLTKVRRICILNSRWYRKNCVGETLRIPRRAHSKAGNRPWGVKTSAESCKANLVSLSRQNQKMTLKPGKFESMYGDFIYRHHTEPHVQLFVSKEKTFPIPLKYIDVTRSTRCKTSALTMIGMSTRTEVCQIRG